MADDEQITACHAWGKLHARTHLTPAWPDGDFLATRAFARRERRKWSHHHALYCGCERRRLAHTHKPFSKVLVVLLLPSSRAGRRMVHAGQIRQAERRGNTRCCRGKEERLGVVPTRFVTERSGWGGARQIHGGEGGWDGVRQIHGGEGDWAVSEARGGGVKHWRSGGCAPRWVGGRRRTGDVGGGLGVGDIEGKRLGWRGRRWWGAVRRGQAEVERCGGVAGGWARGR